MWNSTPSSTTTSPNDNKQNIKEDFDVNDCKCSGGVEQFDQQQQQNTDSKPQTSRFGGQLLCSTNIPQNEDLSADKQFLDVTDETIDSGFISGPQTSTSVNLDTDNEAAGIASCEIKNINITKPLSSESKEYKKTQQQELNIDSGIIEEEYDESKSDFEKRKQSNDPKMILSHNVESGISEWFCNLSLQNNPLNASSSQTNSSVTVSGTSLNNLDSPKQHSEQQTRSSHAVDANALQYQHQTTTLPKQITLANAWEKYYQQNDDGDTPLHLACISGYEDVVTALIRMAPHPCLFNIQNDVAQTPLHLATLTAQPKIIRMLLIAGAKPTARDRNGNTALHLACRSGEEQCVRALTIPISASEVNEAHRQYGHRANDKSYLKYAQLPSDLEIRNYDGERCVHLAAQEGYINILRILVLYGADINAREGKSGHTPLHIAIEKCNEELTNYLLDDCQQLNLETATYAGLTAYQVACILNKSEMQTILEKRGAEPLTPPDSDYDSSDVESDLDDAKSYDRFGDPGYFVGYKGGNTMTVA